MVGSGFLTEAIGEPPATVVGPARPAGLGDPEVVRPGESCRTEIKARWWSQKPKLFMCIYTSKTIRWKKYVTSSRDVRFQI